MAQKPSIFVVGAGSIGSLIATSIAATTPLAADVALILKSKARLQDYSRHDSTLRLWSTIGSRVMLQRNIPAHAVYPRKSDGSSPLPIEHLIVTTKATQTESAIRSLLPSITPDTNILLLQNGIGTLNDLCAKFWPDQASRPSFLLGIASHGVLPADIPWTYKHVGTGTVRVSRVPDDYDPLSAGDIHNRGDSSNNQTPDWSPIYSGSSAVLKNAGSGVTPSVAETPDPTASEESVKADYSSLDIHLDRARTGAPTDSEAAVKADQSSLDIHLDRARQGAPTDSEEAVKAEIEDHDLDLEKARKGSGATKSKNSGHDTHFDRAREVPPTDSEEAVKADIEDHDLDLEKARKGSRGTTKRKASSHDTHFERAREVPPTDSEEAVKAEIEDHDLDLEKARKGSSSGTTKSGQSSHETHFERAREVPPTDSEEAVKADIEDHDLDLEKARKGSSSGATKGNNSTLDHHFHRAREVPPTDSEEAVKADIEDHDLDLEKARKGSSSGATRSGQSSHEAHFERAREVPPTDSEEAVKADIEDHDLDLEKARKGSRGTTKVKTSSHETHFERAREVPPTDSEEAVKADFSELDIHLEKARKGTPTESELYVKADIESKEPEVIKATAEIKVASGSTNSATVNADIPPIFAALLATGSMLNTEVLEFPDFEVAQFEKLVVNACINPLTAILHCNNGKLLEMDNSEKILYDIVKESCGIIRAHAHATLPEQTARLINTHMDPQRVLRIVQDVCKKTAANKSSMLMDVLRGNETELHFVNDYLVRVGKLHRKHTERNAMLSQLVRTQLSLSRKSESGYVPLSSLELS